MKRPRGQKYNRFIMKFDVDGSQNTNSDYTQPFFGSIVCVHFLDDNVCVRLCSGAGEFCAGEILCVHLLAISPFSSVVPLPLITMATSLRKKLAFS